MNMVLICETQKATFVLLKVAFHMLNEVEGFQLNKNINKSFFFFYHDGIHKTAACRPFSNGLSQLQSLLNDQGFSKANPFYPSVLGGWGMGLQTFLPLRHPKMTYTKSDRGAHWSEIHSAQWNTFCATKIMS